MKNNIYYVIGFWRNRKLLKKYEINPIFSNGASLASMSYKDRHIFIRNFPQPVRRTVMRNVNLICKEF